MCNQPQLGLATTKELIDELAARAHVSLIVGESWVSYMTAPELRDTEARSPRVWLDAGKHDIEDLIRYLDGDHHMGVYDRTRIVQDLRQQLVRAGDRR